MSSTSRPPAPRLFHGGLPGLKVGDMLIGGHERQYKDGCPECEAKARGEGYDVTHHPAEVYCTVDRDYARLMASLYGFGDLYRVEFIDGEPFVRSIEDTIESYRTRRLRVAGIVDRAVLLTMHQRRTQLRKAKKEDEARFRAQFL